MNIPYYSTCSLLFSCLEPTARKDAWMRTTSLTVMVIFSKVPFWKLPPHSFDLSTFSTITSHIEYSILKNALQLKIFRTWINIHANFFIKAWVNFMNPKSTNVPEKLSLVQISESTLQRKLHQNRWHFASFDTLLFLSNKISF